jgi:hypothetical protein
MFEVEGKDGVILTLAQEGPMYDGVIRHGETLVWMFCGLGDAISWVMVGLDLVR